MGIISHYSGRTLLGTWGPAFSPDGVIVAISFSFIALGGCILGELGLKCDLLNHVFDRPLSNEIAWIRFLCYSSDSIRHIVSTLAVGNSALAWGHKINKN